MQLKGEKRCLQLTLERVSETEVGAGCRAAGPFVAVAQGSLFLAGQAGEEGGQRSGGQGEGWPGGLRELWEWGSGEV